MKHAATLNFFELGELLKGIDADMPFGHRNRALVAMSVCAGLRASELAALRWEDLLTYKSVTTLNDSFLVVGKGGDRRTVFVSEGLKEYMADYMLNYFNVMSPTGPVFPTKTGKHFSPNAMSQLFTQIYQRAGMQGCTSHSGRRTFITTLHKRGVPTKVIQKLVGHKHLSTTELYIDVTDEDCRNAVDLLK